MAVDAAGNLYIADTGNNTVRMVSTNGVIVTVAGNGNPGPSGDGGPAGYATLNQPQAVAVDPSGELYIADSASIRKVSANGLITSVFTTIPKFSPGALGFDGVGNFYAVNRSDNRVYDPRPSSSGTIMVVAGTAQTPPCRAFPAGAGTDYCLPGTLVPLGDGGPATNAQLNNPQGVAVDAVGNLYIADYGNYRIRKVSRDGMITTTAGNGTQGHSGDGGPATNAQLNAPRGIAVDASGNIYVADSDSMRLLQPVE